MSYTGSEITCDDDIVLRDASTKLILNTDYEVAGYVNNIRTGTAAVIIKGTGNYSGVKTVKSRIAAAKTTEETYLGFWNKLIKGFDRITQD